MKNLKNIANKAILTTGIIMGVLIISTTLANAEPTDKAENEKTKASKVEIVEAELAEQMEADAEFMKALENFNQTSIKVFDSNDQLIYESNVSESEISTDEKLVSLLLRSDFLMQHANTSYYQLSR